LESKFYFHFFIATALRYALCLFVLCSLLSKQCANWINYFLLIVTHLFYLFIYHFPVSIFLFPMGITGIIGNYLAISGKFLPLFLSVWFFVENNNHNNTTRPKSARGKGEIRIGQRA